MGFSPTSKAAGGLVFVGYGITAPELKYDDYAGIDVAGKIVVMLRRTPAVRREGRQAVRHDRAGREDSTARRVRDQDRERRGAQGRRRHHRQRRRHGRRRATRSRSSPTTPIGTTPADSRAVPQARGARLDDRRRADQVARRHRDAHRQGPEAAIVRDQGLEGRRRGDGEPRPSSRCKNVVGVLEGTGPLADETVVIGAHYDHVGYGSFGSLGAARPRAGRSTTGPTTTPAAPPA